MNYTEWCRLCAKEEGKLLKVLRPGNFKILSVIELYLQIEIFKKDRPSILCSPCLHKLDSFEKYLNKVNKAHLLFLELSQNNYNLEEQNKTRAKYGLSGNNNQQNIVESENDLIKNEINYKKFENTLSDDMNFRDEVKDFLENEIFEIEDELNKDKVDKQIKHEFIELPISSTINLSPVDIKLDENDFDDEYILDGEFMSDTLSEVNLKSFEESDANENNSIKENLSKLNKNSLINNERETKSPLETKEDKKKVVLNYKNDSMKYILKNHFIRNIQREGIKAAQNETHTLSEVNLKSFEESDANENNSLKENLSKLNKNSLINNERETKSPLETKEDKKKVVLNYKNDSMKYILKNHFIRNIQREGIKAAQNETRNLKKDKKYKWEKYTCQHCSNYVEQKGKSAYVIHLRKEHNIGFKEDIPPCKYCGKILYTKSSLEIHEDGHLPEEYKQFVCELCGHKSHDSRGLNRHKIIAHTTERPFKCDQCESSFKFKQELQEHKKKLHVLQPVQCDICHKTIKNITYLKKHKFFHKTYKKECTECDIVFSGPKAYVNHMRFKHSSFSDNCILCGKYFTQQWLFKKHMIAHADLKPYKCRFCDLRHNQTQLLNEHEKINHPEEYQLEKEDPLQKVTFRNVTKIPSVDELKEILQQQKNEGKHTHVEYSPENHHAQTIKRNGKNICGLCDESFNDKKALDKHKKNDHPNERPFICDLCKSTFKTKNSLTEHKNKTHVVQPVQCDICHKTMKNSTYLNIHKTFHKNVKKECTHCGEEFIGKRSYTSHMQLKHSNFSENCIVCGKHFIQQKLYKAHLIVHADLKPYKCRFCDLKNNHSAPLNQHEKTNHPQEYQLEKEKDGKNAYDKIIFRQIINIPSVEELKAILLQQMNEGKHFLNV